MGWDLVADIGGTNARFAAVVEGKVLDKHSYSTKNQDDLHEIFAQFIGTQQSSPRRVMVAAAGVINDGFVQLTNAEKKVDLGKLLAIAQPEHIWVINDFEAAAWALATVDESKVEIIRGVERIPTGNRLILGPGTGLGVGMLVAHNGSYSAVAGEGGHIGISPFSATDVPIFEAFQQFWPETQAGVGSLCFEAEAFLSGTGIPRLYEAICRVHGCGSNRNTAKAILDAAVLGEDPAATKTAEMVSSYLGRLVGDLSLFASAKGGVFLTGVLLLQNSWLLNERFIEAFGQGGRFTSYREDIPVYLYTSDDFGIVGGINAFAAK